MTRYKPPTIKERGLKEHIDSLTNGQYDLFVKLVEAKLGYKSIGQVLNIRRETIKRWVMIYKEGLDK